MPGQTAKGHPAALRTDLGERVALSRRRPRSLPPTLPPTPLRLYMPTPGAAGST